MLFRSVRSNGTPVFHLANVVDDIHMGITHVVRGEDLSEVDLPGPDPLELPRDLAAWEPAYPVAEYRSDGARFPSPPAPGCSSAGPTPRPPARP
mgnify:CR=1 FL=1